MLDLVSDHRRKREDEARVWRLARIARLARRAERSHRSIPALGAAGCRHRTRCLGVRPA
jgi:hypothetical protein